MSADISGLTNAVTRTAIAVKSFDVVKTSVKKLDAPSRKSKRKDFW